MLQSIAFIIMLGFILAYICERLRLPRLLGMMITGMLLGPYCLNVLDPNLLTISSSIRQMALVVILIRAGLTLNIQDLKDVGRPAILMCFIPACFEITGMAILAPVLFHISLYEALLMGAVIAAVSPAVIVPKMIHFIEHGYGTKERIPQLILAGASVDDIFVIVLFSCFLSLVQTGNMTYLSLTTIPISIGSGVIVGCCIGYLLVYYFNHVHIRDTIKVFIVLCIAFILYGYESRISQYIPFSALISIMFIAIMIHQKRLDLSKRLSVKYNKIWIGAEIMLFSLVGASVDLSYAYQSGMNALLLIIGVLCFRLLGVFICLLGTKLNMKERVFCMFSYLPKATVQASIGGIPLALGLSCGNLILVVAVLSIIITAPIGAFLIDLTYKKYLKKV